MAVREGAARTACANPWELFSSAPVLPFCFYRPKWKISVAQLEFLLLVGKKTVTQFRRKKLTGLVDEN